MTHKVFKAVDQEDWLVTVLYRVYRTPGPSSTYISFTDRREAFTHAIITGADRVEEIVRTVIAMNL